MLLLMVSRTYIYHHCLDVWDIQIYFTCKVDSIIIFDNSQEGMVHVSYPTVACSISQHDSKSFISLRNLKIKIHHWQLENELETLESLNFIG